MYLPVVTVKGRVIKDLCFGHFLIDFTLRNEKKMGHVFCSSRKPNPTLLMGQTDTVHTGPLKLMGSNELLISMGPFLPK